MDEHKKRKQAERGAQAKRIIESELVKDVFNKIDKAISDGWKNSRPDDIDARQNAYLMNRLLANFKSEFEAIIQTGRNAEKELLNTNPEKQKVI